MIKNSHFTILFASILLLGAFSCGKKETSTKPRLEQITPSIETDAELHAQKQIVTCEENQPCPNYIAKIMVADSPGNYRFCTGFLTDSYTLATSTSCLPEHIRLAGLDCKKDVFIFFAKSGTQGERVACKKILQVSDLDSSNPVLWRDDVTFLKLEDFNRRRKLDISRDGIGNGLELFSWGVEQVNNETAFIRKSECQGLHNSYVNPLAINEGSPSMLIEGCAFKNGFTGGPLLDGNGRVRGMISQGMDPVLLTEIISWGILLKPLRDITHVTNFACAPIMDDTDVGSNERECSKELSQHRLQTARSEMYHPSNLYAASKSKLESNLESNNNFVRFDVKLISKESGNLQEISITPKCYKNVKNMNASGSDQREIYNAPKKAFRKSMDSRGRFTSTEIDNGDEVTDIYFSPKRIRREGVSNLYYYVNGVLTQTVYNLPVCSSLL